VWCSLLWWKKQKEVDCGAEFVSDEENLDSAATRNVMDMSE
jgi:hypothetical protein